jgi:murein DD-endopeptidase MepM/ murein hydrolase activator NlpD
VQLLEANLMEAHELVSRIAELAGIDYEPPEFPDDSVLFAELGDDQKAVISRTLTKDWTLPSGLPVKGFITQDFELEDKEHYHPGIDIACAVGTPVLATGAGTVIYTGYDSTYGKILVIQHNDSLTTVYGHNDSLLAEQGQPVMAGSRIALSGNTGKSTAPHLHYEVRINDQPINPLESTYDQKE